MERRKDNKGRVLKEGESQRKDGMYQYRYTDKFGKRKYLYSKDLKELRKQEDTLKKSLMLYGDFIRTDITLSEVVARYFEIHKSSLRSDTRLYHEFLINKFKDDDFWNQPANNISVTDAKLWVKSIDWSYQTINTFLSILRPAFESACEDGLVTKNPFSFSLSKIMKNNGKKREPITQQQYEDLINFMKYDSYFRHQVDIVIILYETGLRVSELCGLTVNDLDFENNQINIDHQLLHNKVEKYHIRSPKTKAGIRKVPMSPKAKQSFLKVLRTRPIFLNPEPIDGYSNFIFLTGQGHPKLGSGIESMLRRVVKSYNEVHDNQLPNITPHMFRHTFCTRLISSGMDIKSVQYLMGHSTIKMTLEVYAHVNPQLAINDFMKISEGAV